MLTMVTLLIKATIKVHPITIWILCQLVFVWNYVFDLGVIFNPPLPDNIVHCKNVLSRRVVL